MQRFLHTQRFVVILMASGLLLALVIGLWPVHADVFGKASYSCGSGFVHSAHQWDVDSQALNFERTATDNATGSPSTLCPNKVFNRRDISLLILACSLGIGLIAQIVLERPRARSYRSTLFTNRSRAAAKRRVPGPRARIEPPAATARANQSD